MLTLKYVSTFLLTTVFFALSSAVNAKAILEIAPPSTTARSITLAATGSTTLIYSVTNNTKITVNDLSIYPYYGIPGHPLTLTVQNNHCNGSIAPGATCTFGLYIKSNGTKATSVLMPRVCEFKGATCSVPIENNRVSVAAGGVAKSIAYILNAGNNLLSICPVSGSNGALGTCTSSNANGEFNYPTGLIVNPQGTALFVANYGNGAGSTVTICPIVQDGSGTLGTCTTSTGNGTFIHPDGVALNPAGNILYVTNLISSVSSTVSICPVISDGGVFTLGTCTTSTGNGTFSEVQTITINTDNTYAYVCNYNNTISICPVSHNGSGALGTCTTSNGNGTFNFPQGLSFSPDNTYVYVGNYGNGTQSQSTVSICPLLQDGSGGFGTCTVSTGNGTFNFTSDDIIDLFMSSPTYYGYIPNNGTTGANSNTVSVCPINAASHNLNTCSIYSDPSFSQPTAVALSYVISNS